MNWTGQSPSDIIYLQQLSLCRRIYIECQWIPRPSFLRLLWSVFGKVCLIFHISTSSGAAELGFRILILPLQCSKGILNSSSTQSPSHTIVNHAEQSIMVLPFCARNCRSLMERKQNPEACLIVWKDVEVPPRSHSVLYHFQSCFCLHNFC